MGGSKGRREGRGKGRKERVTCEKRGEGWFEHGKEESRPYIFIFLKKRERIPFPHMATSATQLSDEQLAPPSGSVFIVFLRGGVGIPVPCLWDPLY